MQKRILITGGNRGIGLSLVQLYLEQGYEVYTTYRTQEKSAALLAINNLCLKTLQVDFLEPQALDKIVSFLQGRSLDIMIHNASLFPYRVLTLDRINATEWKSAFYVNAIFPILLSYELKENLLEGIEKKVIFISSRRGSNTVNANDNYKGRYGYRTTKAALNAGAFALSQDFRDDDIAVLILHPGRVATEITAFHGVDPHVSAFNISKQIQSLTVEKTGSFVDVESGSCLNW